MTADGMADPLLRSLPPTPVPNIRRKSNLSHLSLPELDVIVQPRHRAYSNAEKQPPVKVCQRDAPKRRKHRRVSWFPPSSSAFGKTSNLPKSGTALTTGRNVISAPVLTSTTNAKVAFTEGVHCGKMTTSGLATSSWDPEPGRITDDNVIDFGKDKSYRVQELQSSSGQKSQPPQHSKGLREFSKGPSRRSASMNALSKVKDAVANRLRQASDPHTYRSVFSRDKFVRLEDDCQPPSIVNDKHPRISTEGRNLGRDKIRALTGHGHVRGKPIQYSGQVGHHALRERRVPCLVDPDGTSNIGYHGTDQIEHEVDFHFEDLETSFSKAVEKLDFRMKRDKASLTSLSSFFHSGRDISASNKTRAPQPSQSLASGLYPYLSSKVDHPPQKASPSPSSEQLVSGQLSMGQCASCISKRSSGRARAPPDVYSFPHQPDPISNEGAGKRDRTALAQHVFARGHSNPLASHPDLTKFAEQPTPRMTDTEMPPRGGRLGVHITHEEHDLSDLEGAPIYSPSLENLSQYGRNTPTSAPGSTNLSSRKLYAASSRLPLIETPTRPSGQGTDRRIKASKYNRHRVKPSTGEAFHTFNAQDETPGAQAKVVQSQDLNCGGDEQIKGILKHKDPNMMIGTDDVNDNGQHSHGMLTSVSRKAIENDYEKSVECVEH